MDPGRARRQGRSDAHPAPGIDFGRLQSLLSLRTTKFRSRLIGATLLVALAAIAVSAEPLTGIPNPRVKDGTWVTDMPRALGADTVARLNQSIGEIERTHGVEMAVVVVRSLDGHSIEESAEQLFNLWGIGKKHRDNGLLFLWSTGDRKVRVEVGYGLEGVLPDGKAAAILDGYVIPRFKDGEFDAGVIAGVDAVLAAARNEPVALPAMGTESYESSGWLSWLAWLGAIPVGIGGITGLRRWRRYRRRYCPQCRTRMSLMSDSDDDEVLDKGQAAEERIGSVDYDIWKCPSCSHQFTLRYAKWVSQYDKCPQCANRTRSSTETVISAATTSSSGSARVVEVCAFCTFTTEYTKELPRISESSSSSGGSSGGGSSFGGGSSGGGGASRGY